MPRPLVGISPCSIRVSSVAQKIDSQCIYCHVGLPGRFGKAVAAAGATHQADGAGQVDLVADRDEYRFDMVARSQHADYLLAAVKQARSRAGLPGWLLEVAD